MTSTTHARSARPRPRRRLRLTLAAVVILGLAGWLGSIAWHAIFEKPAVVDSCQVIGQSSGAVYAMTPEQLLNASIIADVAMRRQLPQRAVLVALATAQQESHLRNLDYGDADSLGLFQQRPSQGWGNSQQVMTPTYAAGKFYDALLKVPNWQSLPVAKAADAVQRSAFPDAVGEWEPRATALSAALTGETLGQLSCQLAHPGVDASAPGGASAEGDGSTQGEAAAVVDRAADAVIADLRDDLQITSPALGSMDSNTRTVAVSGLSDPSSGDASTAKHRTATVAAWGIAHAKPDGITRVVVGDREWRADAHGWRSAKTAAAAGTVVLTIEAR